MDGYGTRGSEVKSAELIETNYVKVISSNGVERYHVTVDGIRKVRSMYS